MCLNHHYLPKNPQTKKRHQMNKEIIMCTMVQHHFLKDIYHRNRPTCASKQLTYTHLIDPGLENRLLCGCCVGTAVGTVKGAGAGAWAGACSLANSVCAISTVPLPASDPKSRAPNWTFKPDISAEPGISTADDGIWIKKKNLSKRGPMHGSIWLLAMCFCT